MFDTLHWRRSVALSLWKCQRQSLFRRMQLLRRLTMDGASWWAKNEWHLLAVSDRGVAWLIEFVFFIISWRYRRGWKKHSMQRNLIVYADRISLYKLMHINFYALHICLCVQVYSCVFAHLHFSTYTRVYIVKIFLRLTLLAFCLSLCVAKSFSNLCGQL